MLKNIEVGQSFLTAGCYIKKGQFIHFEFIKDTTGVDRIADIIERWRLAIKEDTKMAKAMWNGKVLAESDHTEVVEGNHYFPPDSVNKEYLSLSDTRSECPWKGTAYYYHVSVDDSVNSDAAWYYPEPKDAAKQIKDHLAFWKGVEVESMGLVQVEQDSAGNTEGNSRLQGIAH